MTPFSTSFWKRPAPERDMAGPVDLEGASKYSAISCSEVVAGSSFPSVSYPTRASSSCAMNRSISEPPVPLTPPPAPLPLPRASSKSSLTLTRVLPFPSSPAPTLALALALAPPVRRRGFARGGGGRLDQIGASGCGCSGRGRGRGDHLRWDQHVHQRAQRSLQLLYVRGPQIGRGVGGEVQLCAAGDAAPLRERGDHRVLHGHAR
mmetsp:Transcript_12663/g.28114  ORF Transcript_12663/g.28114 Transcript_12663/m.28114 type:complete len:206 (-) Transcript_12663:791-1408(-)